MCALQLTYPTEPQQIFLLSHTHLLFEEPLEEGAVLTRIRVPFRVGCHKARSLMTAFRCLSPILSLIGCLAVPDLEGDKLIGSQAWTASF